MIRFLLIFTKKAAPIVTDSKKRLRYTIHYQQIPLRSYLTFTDWPYSGTLGPGKKGVKRTSLTLETRTTTKPLPTSTSKNSAKKTNHRSQEDNGEEQGGLITFPIENRSKKNSRKKGNKKTKRPTFRDSAEDRRPQFKRVKTTKRPSVGSARVTTVELEDDSYEWDEDEEETYQATTSDTKRTTTTSSPEPVIVYCCYGKNCTKVSNRKSKGKMSKPKKTCKTTATTVQQAEVTTQGGVDSTQNTEVVKKTSKQKL